MTTTCPHVIRKLAQKVAMYRKHYYEVPKCECTQPKKTPTITSLTTPVDSIRAAGKRNVCSKNVVQCPSFTTGRGLLKSF